ncbi:MAG: type IV pili methyl-accepting chemotaxis transducer N-terminal domain-containing protein, partial [Polynucleobacter sp.]
MKNTEFTLKNKLMIIGTTLLVLAMISISFTLWVTWKLEGGAAAINEAGRMRMQTYQLALLANEQDLMATQKLIEKFNGSINVLKTGDPARPLFVPWNSINREYFSQIQNQWEDIKEGLSKNKGKTISVVNINNFVSRIDEFVGSIELEVDYWTGMLHLFQFAMLAISLVATLIIMYVGYSVILDPVEKLRIGFESVKSGRLNTRVQIEAKDEFGDLA